MKNTIFFLLALVATTAHAQQPNADHVGVFNAEGKNVEVKFVRVLYAAEGSEIEGESNSVKQLLFDSKDPSGAAIKAYRFQVVAKNTGYDVLQTTHEGDYKLKSVTEGVKLHIEVPVVSGQMQLDRAFISSMAYNFGTRETRNLIAAEDVADIQLKIERLDLPKFGAENKPGDGAIIYNAGFIDLTLTSKVKHIQGDQVSDFTVAIKGPISITQVRGQERSDRAVIVNEALVRKNRI